MPRKLTRTQEVAAQYSLGSPEERALTAYEMATEVEQADHATALLAAVAAFNEAKASKPLPCPHCGGTVTITATGGYCPACGCNVAASRERIEAAKLRVPKANLTPGNCTALGCTKTGTHRPHLPYGHTYLCDDHARELRAHARRHGNTAAFIPGAKPESKPAIPCPDCNATGMVLYGADCERCNGTGYLNPLHEPATFPDPSRRHTYDSTGTCTRCQKNRDATRGIPCFGNPDPWDVITGTPAAPKFIAPRYRAETCQTCDGKGRLITTDRHRNTTDTVCDHCGGNGYRVRPIACQWGVCKEHATVEVTPHLSMCQRHADRYIAKRREHQADLRTLYPTTAKRRTCPHAITYRREDGASVCGRCAKIIPAPKRSRVTTYDAVTLSVPDCAPTRKRSADPHRKPRAKPSRRTRPTTGKPTRKGRRKG